MLHAPLGLSLGERVLQLDLRHWINDGPMAIFFFAVGLEIKRELLVGEHADRRKAMLRIAAAIGGMVMPALCYAAVNSGGVSWRHVSGTAWLAGIGFTMALFISGLAFTGIGLESQAKLGIRGSVVSAVVGLAILLTARRLDAVAPPGVITNQQASAVPTRRHETNERNPAISFVYGRSMSFAVALCAVGE